MPPPTIGGVAPGAPITSRTGASAGRASADIATPAPSDTGAVASTAAPVPPLDAAWGTADSVALVAAAPDRRWMVLCQARRDTNGDGRVDAELGQQGELRGDALDGWFLASPDAGTRIDAFVGSDPSGRYLAFVQGGHLVLRDTTTGNAVSLAADLRDDLGSFVPPRVGSFDPTGRRFLYFRAAAGGEPEIAVRELATGTEALVDPGDGEPWRADFDPSGDWVIVRVVTADTNGNGRLDWPARESTAPRMRCPSPLPRYSVWERPGDEASPRVARATGGKATDAPGLIVPFGDALIVRESDAALVRVDPNGRRTPIAAKACQARVLHADAARGALLYTCLDRKGRADARLATRSGTRPLGLLLSASPGDHVHADSPRLIALHPGNDAALVDLDAGDARPLTPGDRVLGTSGAHALVLRGPSLVLHDLDGSEHALSGSIASLAHFVRSGSMMVVPPFIVDVAAGRLVGTTQASPVAVASDGAVLVPSGGDADATHFAKGPLRWVSPEAASREPVPSPNGLRAVPLGVSPAP